MNSIATLPRIPSTPAARVRLAQLEAKSAAVEQAELALAALNDASRLLLEIADGGEAYPVGARELGRRVAPELAQTALTLRAIVERVR